MYLKIHDAPFGPNDAHSDSFFDNYIIISLRVPSYLKDAPVRDFAG